MYQFVYIFSPMIYNTTMSLTAAGAYLRTLREKNDWSRSELADFVRAAGEAANISQIEKIESGKINTRSSLLMIIIDLVGGDANHVKTLIRDQDATIEDGEILALHWITRRKVTQIQEQADAVPVEELDDALAVIRRLRGQIQGHGDLPSN